MAEKVRYRKPPGTTSRNRHVFSIGQGRQHPPDVEEILRSLQTQQIVDPFREDHGTSVGVAGDLAILEPPYNFSALMRYPRENNMLRQCIDAMVTNIEGHGWRLEFIGEDPDQKDSDEAQNEKIVLENLLEFPNDDHSLAELRERVRRDLETTGNAYIEIGRDLEQRVCLVAHVPGHTVRLTGKDKEEVLVTVTLPREGTAREQKIRKRFRRFVQAVGAKKTFFKEFGDPRTIDPATGRINDELGDDESATEIIHLRVYAPGTAYGVPRWINQLPAIMGSRQSELTNLEFFTENAIPAMAVLISGGGLTQESVDDIEEQIIAGKGRGSMNRVVVLEARGDQDAASDDGSIPAPKIDMKPLQGDRQKDALFQDYDKNNMAKVRSSFRIPPVFVGMSQDYTHATAKTSFEVAESQVFGPERAKSDEIWNLKILGSYNPQFWAFRSNPPRIADPADVVAAIKAFDEAGAMTPNKAIELANEFFDLEATTIDDIWGDLPLAFTIALVDAGILPKGVAGLKEGADVPPPPTISPSPVAGAPPPGGEEETPPPEPTTRKRAVRKTRKKNVKK